VHLASGPQAAHRFPPHCANTRELASSQSPFPFTLPSFCWGTHRTNSVFGKALFYFSGLAVSRVPLNSPPFFFFSRSRIGKQASRFLLPDEMEGAFSPRPGAASFLPVSPPPPALLTKHSSVSTYSAQLIGDTASSQPLFSAAAHSSRNSLQSPFSGESRVLIGKECGIDHFGRAPEQWRTPSFSRRDG